uniref:Uncharacterized protein n=1 Tax=Proboscia inermis TaxID=420281 RepID=A0A7S0BWN4_9STRA
MKSQTTGSFFRVSRIERRIPKIPNQFAEYVGLGTLNIKKESWFRGYSSLEGRKDDLFVEYGTVVVFLFLSQILIANAGHERARLPLIANKVLSSRRENCQWIKTNPFNLINSLSLFPS